MVRAVDGRGVEGPPSDLARLFARAMERHAARPLFGVERDGRFSWTTYGEIGRQATALATALRRLGVKSGDRVAVLSSNRAEWAVAAGASLACGAVVVPMYEAQLEKDWRFILDDSGATVCFVSTAAIHGRVEAMRPSLPSLRAVIGFDRAEADDASDASLAHVIASATREAPGAHDAGAGIDRESLAAIIYTSGTTGAPKGVALTHLAFARTLAAMQAVWSPGPRDRTVSILPWAHVGGFFELFMSIDSGCAVAIPASLEKLMATIAATRPTSLVGVPRIWNKLYDAIHKGIAAKPRAVQWLFHTAIAAQNRRNAGLPLRRRERVARRVAQRAVFPAILARLGGELRFAVTGAAALSRDVAELMEGLGITVIEVYGQTEVCAIATANAPGDARLGTVGKALPGVRVTIDREGASADDGSGEVILHGPGVMRGYHGLAAETAAVLTPDGGVRTGDLGRIDDRGFLTITGRVREVYKLENGKFVSPVPIEEALTLSPYIAQAMVHGLNAPHNVALLVLDPAAIRAFCDARGFAPPSNPGTDPRVRDLVARELTRCTSPFKGYERVQRFAVIDEEWTTANDMLTPSMKLKRRNVLARYRAEVDALYL